MFFSNKMNKYYISKIFSVAHCYKVNNTNKHKTKLLLNIDSDYNNKEAKLLEYAMKRLGGETINMISQNIGRTNNNIIKEVHKYSDIIINNHNDYISNDSKTYDLNTIIKISNGLTDLFNIYSKFNLNNEINILFIGNIDELKHRNNIFNYLNIYNKINIANHSINNSISNRYDVIYYLKNDNSYDDEYAKKIIYKHMKYNVNDEHVILYSDDINSDIKNIINENTNNKKRHMQNKMAIQMSVLDHILIEDKNM